MEVGKVVPQDFHIWEGHASFVIFTIGCNMQCPYCFVPDLVRHRVSKLDWFPKLRPVIHSIDSVVITGGEPLMQKYLPVVCKKLKLEGLKVRIETNGSKPDVLKSLIRMKVIDSVALDVKAPFGDYQALTNSQVSPENVKKSIGLLQESGIEHELRTTWSPNLTEEQIAEIAKQCSGSTWVLQEFKPGGCLDASYDSKEQTNYEKLKSLASRVTGPARVLIKTGKGEELIR
ncbi:MAG: anaerobic ribonucleoside-triphosphate reductase activating protein [Candidatus Diapherotrites archaeon]|nr:anaerobic ribonucleoside-triphosphate reductase activating protein [Candidatus Diapherotrites archaeon]